MNTKMYIFLIALTLSACSGTKPTPTPESSNEELENDQTDEASAEAPREFDERLSTFVYPYKVKIFDVTHDGGPLEMAYMHLEPQVQSTKPTVLLLHGKNFSGAYWKPVADSLLAKGFSVVMPDQLGFGKSSKPLDYPYSFHQLAANTKLLLDSLNVEKVAVVGHSMGGMLATRFALMYPDLTSHLILANPIGLEDWKTMVPFQSADTWYASELKKTPEKIRAYMTASYFDGNWKPEYEPLVALQAGWTQDADYPTIARTSALHYDMIFTQPVLYEFGAIESPTLLIIGDRDRTALGKNLVSADVKKTMGLYGELGPKTQKAIPGAELLMLPGIGHIPQYESFVAFQTALESFLVK